MSAELKQRVEALDSKISIDKGRRGFDDSAVVIYEALANKVTLQTLITDKVVINFIEEQRAVIKELAEREAKLVECLKMFMEIGDQCSRGYITRCHEKVKSLGININEDVE